MNSTDNTCAGWNSWLNQLLAMAAGNDVSVGDLRLNPQWDPIRKDPRFQALLKKYGGVAPANASTAATAAAVSGTASLHWLHIPLFAA